MELKERVKRTGIKHGKLANMLGCTQSELSMWLSGSRPMPDDIKKHLERILKAIESALEA